jgi:hypothetical protein
MLFFKVQFDPRVSHLSTLFLRGLENLQFANDVCGQPMDTMSFEIASVFSGKLFSLKYTKAHNHESTLALCGGNVSCVFEK